MSFNLRFNEAEVKALVELILNTNEISVATCFLLIYSPLYEADGNFQRIIQWLKDKFSQAQQSLLLLAIYCNSHQLNVRQIAFVLIIKSKLKYYSIFR